MPFKRETEHKPVIETLINTAALALTSYGIIEITSGSGWGYCAILFSVGLEYFKYKGRQQKLW